MPQKNRIVAVTRDPGGTRVIAPVLSELARIPAVELKVMCGSTAEPVLRDCGIEHDRFPEPVESEAIRRWLAAYRPELMFSSTGIYSDFEQRWRNEAHRQGVPVISVLDFWANYRGRWGHADYQIGNVSELIGVMDEACRQEMIAEGFPHDRVRVVGHPHLERLWENAVDPSPTPEKRVRILFLSEPLQPSELAKLGEHPLQPLGRALADISRDLGVSFTLLVKKHPNEQVTPDLERALSFLRELGLLAGFDAGTVPALRMLDEHDWVAGYTTMGLFEAAIRGKTAIGMKVRELYPSLVSALEFNHVRMFLPDEGVLRTGLTSVLRDPRERAKRYQGDTRDLTELVLRWRGY